MRALRIAGRVLLWGFAAIGLAATLLALYSIDMDSGCGRCTSARAQIAILEGVLELYKMDSGAYPATEQGLAALAAFPEVEPIPSNYPACGYLKSARVPLDPWGRRSGTAARVSTTSTPSIYGRLVPMARPGAKARMLTSRTGRRSPLGSAPA